MYQTNLSAADAASIFKSSRRLRSREIATLYRHEKSCDQLTLALVFMNSGTQKNPTWRSERL